MKEGSYFIEPSEEGDVAYRSSLISNPAYLQILANKTAMTILKELVKEPSCALDIARRLKLHEQKVYYNIRRLEKAEIIKLIRTEERAGGTAKIYGVVSPVVSVKLYEDGFGLPVNKQTKEAEFLKPFIEKGEFNALIVVGNPYPHGKYEATPRDIQCAIDLALFLGSFITKPKFPSYKLDTQIKENDLKQNLILIGGPKVNIITDKLNSKLPIYFDEKKDWSITSRFTKKVYGFDYDSVLIRMKNPFNKSKEILVLGGKRSLGTISSVIAFTQHINEIMKEANNKKEIIRVVQGVDKDGDGMVDVIKFLE